MSSFLVFPLEGKEFEDKSKHNKNKYQKQFLQFCGILLVRI
jgi:hypothetical protein